MAVTGTFTAVGVSAEILPTIDGVMSIQVSNGVGTVVLEHTPFGGRIQWRVQTAHSLEIKQSGATYVQVKAGEVYRLHCTAYTSGTVLYNVSVPENVVAYPPQDLGNLGGRFAVMGDSISANGGIDSGTAVPPTQGLASMPANGYINWLPFISRQRVQIEPGSNFSLSGRTTADIATQIYNVIRYQPTWVIVEGGTNDPGNVMTTQQTITNLTTIFQAMQQARIKVLCIPVTPRTTPSGYTTAQNQNIAQVNRFIREYARQHGNIIIADPRHNGFQAASGVPATGTTADNLHPNQNGAKIFGVTLWNALSPFIQSVDGEQIMLDPLDIYDATNNVTGNMLTNGLFQTTTGGTLTGNSVLTGSVPGSWTALWTKADTTYTGTAAITNVAHPTAGFTSSQLFRVTTASLVGTVTGGVQDNLQLSQSINFPTGLQPGDVLESMCEVRAAMTTGFCGMSIHLNIFDGLSTTSTAAIMGAASNSSGWAQGTYSGVLKTQRTVVGPALGATTRTVKVIVLLYFDTTPGTGTATGTIDIGSVSLRKVLPV